MGIGCSSVGLWRGPGPIPVEDPRAEGLLNKQDLGSASPSKLTVLAKLD